MVYTLRLRNSILGWMLLPDYDNWHPQVRDLMDYLHGEAWENMSPKSRAFCDGQPVEAAISHLKDVCKEMNLSMSLCGNRQCPAIRIWWQKPVVDAIEEVDVDLRWVCWSPHKTEWESASKGVWHRMHQAFVGKDRPVRINTAPKKECWYGSVIIRKGRADGWFACEWDDSNDLANTLGVACDEAFVECLPVSSKLQSIGTEREVALRARKFTSLMQRLYSEEVQLHVYDTKLWKYIEQQYRSQ